MEQESHFQKLMRETTQAEKNFPELNESDALGVGPGTSPEMTGKDPDLSNVNEEGIGSEFEDNEEDISDEDLTKEEILSSDAMKAEVLSFIESADDEDIESIYKLYIDGSSEDYTEEDVEENPFESK